MCGFGDKVRQSIVYLTPPVNPLSSYQDRRPLAPATVAKLVIKNEDQSLVNDE